MTASSSSRPDPGWTDGKAVRGRPGRRVAAVVAVAVVWMAHRAGSAFGHPDTWHTIELISAQMATGDRRPALYYARATEYQAVECWVEAEADLRACLRQDPGFFPAARDLGPVLLSAGRPEEAVAAAHEAVRMGAGRPAASLAAAWAELGRVEAARGKWAEVLAATDEALKLVPRGEVDWYLLRERAFLALGKRDEAIADLARGGTALRSTLLRSCWLDALLEAGRAEETLAPIEVALGETRYQAPWLIRRARARALLGQTDSARDDNAAALAELDARIIPEEPDPSLLVLKGLALAGLGRRDEAATALAAARASRPDPSLLLPLERVLHPP